MSETPTPDAGPKHKVLAEITELRFVEDEEPGPPPFGGGVRRAVVIVARISVAPDDVTDPVEAEALVPSLGGVYALELVRAPRKTLFESLASPDEAATTNEDPKSREQED